MAHNITGCDYYQETSSQRGILCSDGKAYVQTEDVDKQVFDVISNLKLPESWREMLQVMLGAVYIDMTTKDNGVKQPG